MSGAGDDKTAGGRKEGSGSGGRRCAVAGSRSTSAEHGVHPTAEQQKRGVPAAATTAAGAAGAPRVDRTELVVGSIKT